MQQQEIYRLSCCQICKFNIIIPPKFQLYKLLPSERQEYPCLGNGGKFENAHGFKGEICSLLLL